MANPWEFNWEWDDLALSEPGQTAPGNIDTTRRPRVRNPDGSISTVDSMSIGTDQGEVLIPQIGQDARGRGVRMTPEQSIRRFKSSGENLGTFNSPEEATAYAQGLHESQQNAIEPWTMNWDWKRAEASAATKGPLRHDLESQKFKRPEGEFFHGEGFIEGAPPDQSRVLGTDETDIRDATGLGVIRGVEDLAKTYGMVTEGNPEIETAPLTKLDNPVDTANDSWGMLGKKFVHRAARMFPAVLGYAAGAEVGAPAIAGDVLLGGTGGSMLATLIQTAGPRLEAALEKYPDDPDKAYDEAMEAALIDTGFAGLGGLVLGVTPFKSELSNFMFQSLALQPFIGMQGMRAAEYATGDYNPDMTQLDRYAEMLGPGIVQGAVGAAVLPAHGPTRASEPAAGERHFLDAVPEISPVEKRVSDAGNFERVDPFYDINADIAAVRDQPGGPGLRKESLPAFPPERLAKVAQAVDEAVARIAPHASLRFAKMLHQGMEDGTVGRATGGNLGKMIAVALDSQDPVGTGKHEAGHALEAFKDMGVFKPHEWQALEDAVATGWAEKHAEFLAPYYQMHKGDPVRLREVLTSETIMQEIATARPEQFQKYPPLVRKVMYRIKALLKQIAVAAKRAFGAKVTGDDVLDMMDLGVMGRRAKQLQHRLPSGMLDWTHTRGAESWIGNRGEVAAQLEGYHGTTKAYDRIQRGTDDRMLDRSLGVHIAKDPAISNSFVLEPTLPRRAIEGGRIYKAAIPDEHEMLRVDQKGTRTDGSDYVRHDEHAIEKMVMREAYKASPEMLARYLTQARNVKPKEAPELARRMVAGERVTVGHDGEHTLDSFIENFGGKPYTSEDRQLAVQIARDAWQEQGYKGLIYENTSPMETQGAKDRTSYIVFEPDDIRHPYDRNIRLQIEKGRIDPLFRSALDEALMKTKLTKGHGSQWRSELVKQGTKLEELQDTGLDDLLTENADKPLTLDDIKKVREENRHQLEVIELTDGTGDIVNQEPEPAPFEPEPNMPERYAPEADVPEGPPNPLLGLAYDGEPITPELAQALIDDFVDGGPLDEAISEEAQERISETDDYDTSEWPRWRYEVKEDDRPVYEVEEIDGHGDNVEYHDRYDDRHEAERDADDSEGTYFTIKEVPVQEPQELPLLSRIIGQKAKSEEINRYEVWRSSEDTTDEGFNGEIVDGDEEPVKVFDSWAKAEKYAKDETRRFRVSENERYDEWRLWDRKEDDWHSDGDTYESERSAQRAEERANDDWHSEWYEGVIEEAESDVRNDKDWVSEKIADHLYTEVSDADDPRAIRKWVDHVRGTGRRTRQETPEYRTWASRNAARQREYDAAYQRWVDRNRTRDDTHYRTYANEGGTNYRELILTVPTMTERGKGHSGHSQHSDKMVAHARTQDFPSSDGRKVKAIEELQSDTHQGASDKYWGKEGRKRRDADLAVARQENAATARDLTKALDEWAAVKAKVNLSDADTNALRYKSARQMIEEQLTPHNEYFRRNYPGLFTPEAREVLQRWKDASDRDEAAYRKVQNLEAERITSYPHRKSWPMVLFKKILIDAVKRGSDIIALATGQQNTDRYEYALRGAVKHVEWGQRSDDPSLYDVKFTMREKTRDGKDVHMLTGVTLDRIADYIGKAGAKQIELALGAKDNPNGGPMFGPVEKTDYVNAGGYEGQNIKFGGVGMYNFYDKVMPAEIDKFLKKYGVSRRKVKLLKAGVKPWAVFEVASDGIEHRTSETHSTKEGAERDAKALKQAAVDNVSPSRASEFVVRENPDAYHEVLGWDIPDALREDINSGDASNTPEGVVRLNDKNPVFRYQLERAGKTAPADPRVNTPEFRAWWKKSKVHDGLLHPKRVYHGSADMPTDAFSADRASPNAFWGARFYFTSDPADAHDNYASPTSSGDLQAKIGRKVASDLGPNNWAPGVYDQRVATAAKQLPTPGAVMPVYLSIQNPLYAGGPKATKWGRSERARFADALQSEAEVWGKDGAAAWSRAAEEAEVWGNDKVAADEFYERVVGRLGGGRGYREIGRAALERMGYDGVIDTRIKERFNQKTVTDETTHYIAFKPNQIKSVFNQGTWSDKANFMLQIIEGPKDKWKGPPKTYDVGYEDTLSEAPSIDALMEGFRRADDYFHPDEFDDGGPIYIDNEVYLSDEPDDLAKVYSKDWINVRSGPQHTQWAIMTEKGPVGRLHGTINGDALEVGWLGVLGGEEGLSSEAFMMLGAALKHVVSPRVKRITGLRKSKVGAYEKPQAKASSKPTPQAPARPTRKVRVARPARTGLQKYGPDRKLPDDDPILQYYREQGM